MLYKWTNPKTDNSDVEPVQETTLESFEIVEKELEDVVARRIEDLIRTDQLMVVKQEIRGQAQPDILGLDHTGKMYIFELKRWQGRSEDLLQALRYGQKLGRYDYDSINRLFQSYRRDERHPLELQTAHAEYFELDKALEKSEFNKEQCFVVITNGLDYDTWDAIAYWRKQGINIYAHIYRIFKINEEPFIDFDPFGPVPDAPRQQSNGLFVINTNKTYMPEAFREMVRDRKGSAYYEKRHAIQRIKVDDPVCLYHTGRDAGIIGIGKAKSEYQIKDVDGDPDKEYYVEIDFDYLVDLNKPDWQSNAIHAYEVNEKFNASYRFRQTVFQLPGEYIKFINEQFAAKGVGRP